MDHDPDPLFLLVLAALRMHGIPYWTLRDEPRVLFFRNTAVWRIECEVETRPRQEQIVVRARYAPTVCGKALSDVRDFLARADTEYDLTKFVIDIERGTIVVVSGINAADSAIDVEIIGNHIAEALYTAGIIFPLINEVALGALTAAAALDQLPRHRVVEVVADVNNRLDY
jgi:hypothetical protein